MYYTSAPEVTYWKSIGSIQESIGVSIRFLATLLLGKRLLLTRIDNLEKAY